MQLLPFSPRGHATASANSCLLACLALAMRFRHSITLISLLSTQSQYHWVPRRYDLLAPMVDLVLLIPLLALRSPAARSYVPQRAFVTNDQGYLAFPTV